MVVLLNLFAVKEIIKTILSEVTDFVVVKILGLNDFRSLVCRDNRNFWTSLIASLHFLFSSETKGEIYLGLMFYKLYIIFKASVSAHHLVSAQTISHHINSSISNTVGGEKPGVYLVHIK